MIRVIVSISLLLVGVGACGAEGKQGPAGPAGPAGTSGPPGTSGAAGKNGDSGTNGADGTSEKIVSNVLCQKIDTYNFHYRQTTFSTGDVFVECDIAGAAFTVSNSVYFAADEVGATSGGCQIVFDIDAASAGYLVFLGGASPSATYHDAASASDGLVESFAGDCTTAT